MLNYFPGPEGVVHVWNSKKGILRLVANHYHMEYSLKDSWFLTVVMGIFYNQIVRAFENILHIMKNILKSHSALIF